VDTIKATSETIMCTLSAAELEDTSAAWQRLFREWLVARELVPGGLRLTVIPGAEPALRQLVGIEVECCGWITFDFDGPSVKMTAAGEAGEHAIREMWAGSGGANDGRPPGVKPVD
jgi:hypothetical protein